MSFYDDASLVFLPSGQAGKDGKAYSMKPVPEYGNELVTNGGFDTDSDWVKGTGWTISGGTANCDGTQTSTSSLNSSSFSITGSTQLKLSFSVTNYVSGILNASITGTGQADIQDIESNGNYSVIVTTTTGSRYVNFTAEVGFIGSIDNVSVKEVVVGDGDFTFSRGSNLTATRVDSNGLIEKGRENLLLQSNQFDTTWTTSNASVTSGQSGYDGSSDAWKLEADSDGNGRRINQSITQGGVCIFSVYVKSGNTDFIRLNLNGAGNCFFNISESSPSVLTSSDVNLVGSIQAIGNGWNRCSLLNLTGSSIIEVRINLASGDNDLSAVTGDNIYIQDAQLEQGLVATDYIESGATTGLAGILEDSPRFDYSGGASCPSLLLEPSRTNLIGYSEYANGSGWVIVSSGTIVDNVDTSPEGVVNAFSFETTTFGALRYNVTLSTSTTYTFSFYAKNVDATIANYRVFDITNSSDLVSQTSYFSQISTSEWSRIEFSFTTNATSTLYGVYPTSGNQNGTIQFYGAQLEQASYSTSYIPNHSGGSVTRNADTCSGAGDASTFNDDEGVLYAEIAALANDGGIRYLSLSDGGSNNRVVILFDSAADRIRAIVSSGGVKYFDENTESYDVLDFHKIAVRYKRDDFSLWVDGTNVASVSSGSSPIGLNELSYNLGGSNTIFSKSKQLIVFNSFLSDVEMITLTS